MIYLLYGPDTYRSREKLRGIVEGYRQKYGSFLNFSRFDAAEKDIADLKIAGKVQSLFGGKRLLVVENIFSCPEETFSQAVKIVPFLSGSAADILIFWDGAEKVAAERLGQMKKIVDKSQKFEKLDRAGILRWLERECGERKIDFQKYKFSLLAEAGEDLWRLKNELDKLEVGGFTGGAPRPGVSVFQFSDNFFGNKREALKSLVSLLKSGEDEFRLFGFISSHLRTLLKVGRAVTTLKSPAAITANLKLHPFVVQKAIAETEKKDAGFLASLFRRLFEEDLAIKTGESTPATSILRLLFFRPK